MFTEGFSSFQDQICTCDVVAIGADNAVVRRRQGGERNPDNAAASEFVGSLRVIDIFHSVLYN